MVCANDKNHSSRRPAEDYRKRARAVIERLMILMRIHALPENWRQPTEEEMEGLIDEFHGIMNRAVRGAQELGYALGHFPGPLTEEEMRFVESRFPATEAEWRLGEIRFLRSLGIIG